MLKGRALPALLATGRVMGVYGVTFAAIGGIFAAVDVRCARAAAPACVVCMRAHRSLVRNPKTGAPGGATHSPPLAAHAQCTAEGVRGKKDFWNGVLGGAAAGSVIGVRGARAAPRVARMCFRRTRARSPAERPAPLASPFCVSSCVAGRGRGRRRGAGSHVGGGGQHGTKHAGCVTHA